MYKESKQNQIENRIKAEVNYLIQHKCTIRQLAKIFGVSKSTIHKDMTDRLKLVDSDIAKKVHMILEFNKNQRHIRGGLATQIKYKFS